MRKIFVIFFIIFLWTSEGQTKYFRNFNCSVYFTLMNLNIDYIVKMLCQHCQVLSVLILIIEHHWWTQVDQCALHQSIKNAIILNNKKNIATNYNVDKITKNMKSENNNKNSWLALKNYLSDFFYGWSKAKEESSFEKNPGQITSNVYWNGACVCTSVQSVGGQHLGINILYVIYLLLMFHFFSSSPCSYCSCVCFSSQWKLPFQESRGHCGGHY